jgi:(p)ppGpp synthase/HD superfamily hydrolase
MSFEECSRETTSALQLRVTAEADAGLLARLLGTFQNLNIIPVRVLAELSSANVLSIHIDIKGLAESRLAGIAAKVGQLPSVLSAGLHTHEPSHHGAGAGLTPCRAGNHRRLL